jgi:membrane-bound lytic murein transglycosylase D
MKNFIFIFATLLGVIIISIFLFQSFSAKGDENSPTEPLPVSVPIAKNDLQPGINPLTATVYPAQIPLSVNFAGETAPLDVFYVREYLDRELTSNTFFHSSTILLFKRANRWFPVIEPILAENGIPADFKYLALIESGLENVTSPAGAKGFWQFLAHTAREYGLEVNSGIDERYNVEKSTAAACKYLHDAYEKYGNWTLAAAAYNAGNRRISGELKEQMVDNYYDLYLNLETARYVFRILAIKTIFENPKNYGFYLSDADLYPPIPTRKITVTKTIKNLVEFAREHGINYKTLKYFNPWLRQDYLPNRSRRTYHIAIPANGNITYSAIRDYADQKNTAPVSAKD